MRYAIYINRNRKRACWHREGCGHISKHGGTAKVADQDWVWCDSVAAVRRELAKHTRGFNAADVRPCGICHPDAVE